MFWEPKVKALWHARDLRCADGDGVYLAQGRKKGRRVKREVRNDLMERTLEFADKS